MNGALKMRKKLLIVLTCLTCGLACGCANQAKNETTENTESIAESTIESNGKSENDTSEHIEETTAEKVVVKQELPNYTWAHYDTVLGEELLLTLNENGDYSYRCACGEHLKEAAGYNAFSYNDRTRIFRIYNQDDGAITNKEHLALYMDKYTLVVNTGEDTIEFYNAEIGTSGLDGIKEHLCEETCGAMLADYDGYDVILDMNENEVVLGPVYDTGIEDWIVQRTVKLADNVEFYTLQIQTLEQGAGQAQEHVCQCEQVAREEIEKKVTESSAYAFIWYDWNGKAEKVVVW
jgi:hypothetical protein